MIKYLKANIQFLIVLLIWTISGMVFWQSLLVLVPATVLLFMKQDMYVELLLAFWFILILSDSFEVQLEFAKKTKPIFLLLFGLVLLARRKQLLRGKNKVLTAFLPFFILGFIVIFKSPIPLVSFQKTLSYFLLFAIVPVMVNYYIYDDERAFYRKIVFFGVLVLAIGLVSKYAGAEWVYKAERYRGILGNPNSLGLFTALLYIMYLVFLQLRPDTFDKNEKITISVFVIWSLLLCQSRTAMLAIIIFYLFRKLYKFSPLMGFVVFVSVIATYQTVINFLPMIAETFGLEEYMRLETIESGSGRYVAWNYAWENIKEHMLVGRGVGYTDYLFKENYYQLSRLGHQGNAHNSPLTIWLNTGIIGLVLFEFAFLYLILAASKFTRAALPFYFAVMFSSYFESWLTGSLNPFTIVFLVILSVFFSKNTMKREENNIEPEEELKPIPN